MNVTGSKLLGIFETSIGAPVATRPLPRDGGMVEDHGAPEAGQLSTPGPEVVERQSRRKASGTKNP